jgi:hypothetical protein
MFRRLAHWFKIPPLLKSEGKSPGGNSKATTHAEMGI